MRFIAYERWLQEHIDRAVAANEHIVATGNDWIENQFIINPDERHPECLHYFIPAPRERWHYPMGKPRLIPQPKPLEVRISAEVRIVLREGQYGWKLPVKRRRPKRKGPQPRLRRMPRITPQNDPRQIALTLQ